MFHHPWLLLLLLLLPWIGWRKWQGQRANFTTFSTTAFAEQLRPTLRERLMWLPGLLHLLAMGLLIVALAGPRAILERTVTHSDGIAIQLVVDLSSSMLARDFQVNDQAVDRLTAVKEVVGRFVLGDQSLQGRSNDLIGLITFARFADNVTPLTLDHGFLVSRLEESEIVMQRREDGTAIGDALALAVEKLTAIDRKTSHNIKSRIIILLTDGENTAGELEPLQAAELAKAVGIKVYTIGAGTRGQAPFPFVDPFSGREGLQMVQVKIDEATLSRIAAITGGEYFRATDTQTLERIYDEVDRLEKSKVEDRVYIDYRELAIEPMKWGRWSLPPLAYWPLGLLAAHLLLKRTWLREFGV